MSRKHIVFSREMNLQYLNCNEQTVFKGMIKTLSQTKKELDL